MHCVQRMIRIGELARMAGVTSHYIRKWSKQGRIPNSKRPGEQRLYPEDEALEAIQQLLIEGGLDPASVQSVVTNAINEMPLAVGEEQQGDGAG